MFVFRDNTYTDRSLSCQLEFEAAPISIVHLLVISAFVSGPHLYLSVIVLSVRVRGRTYIDRPSPFHVSLCFWGRTYIDRPSPCYISLCFGATPISIDHLLVMLVCVSAAAPISIGHRLVISVCVSGQHVYRSVIVLSARVRGRTYIDWPSPCHISLCFGTAPISIGHCLGS